MTTLEKTTKQTAASLIEAEIAELKGALESLGETEMGSAAFRQETAIIDRLEALEIELEALEGAYYNDLAEGLGY